MCLRSYAAQTEMRVKDVAPVSTFDVRGGRANLFLVGEPKGALSRLFAGWKVCRSRATEERSQS